MEIEQRKKGTIPKSESESKNKNTGKSKGDNSLTDLPSKNQAQQEKKIDSKVSGKKGESKGHSKKDLKEEMAIETFESTSIETKHEYSETKYEKGQKQENKNSSEKNSKTQNKQGKNRSNKDSETPEKREPEISSSLDIELPKVENKKQNDTQLSDTRLIPETPTEDEADQHTYHNRTKETIDDIESPQIKEDSDHENKDIGIVETQFLIDRDPTQWSDSLPKEEELIAKSQKNSKSKNEKIDLEKNRERSSSGKKDNESSGYKKNFEKQSIKDKHKQSKDFISPNNSNKKSNEKFTPPKKKESEKKKKDDSDSDESESSIAESDKGDKKDISGLKSPAEMEDDSRDHCDVCYSNVSRRFLMPELKPYFELIFCKNCNVSAHNICYGIETKFEEILETSQRKKYFLCDVCKEGAKREEIQCHVCSTQKGILRKSKDGKWIHPLCAVGTQAIKVENVSSMNIDLSVFRKESQKLRAIKKCEICKSKVETFRCNNENSIKHCHLHCALRQNYVRPDVSPWRVYFSISPDKKVLSFQQYDPEVLSNNVQDMCLTIKDVIEENDITQDIPIFKELKPKRISKFGRGKKRIKEDPEAAEFLSGVLEKTKGKVEIDFADSVEIKSSQKEDDLKRVGGEITVIYTPETPNFVEEEDSQANDNAEWIFKDDMRTMNKEILNNNALLEVYSDNRIAKFKSELTSFPSLKKISFPELLFFINVYEKRVETAYNNLVDIEDLKKLVEISNMFPFSLSGMLGKLNEKYYTAIALDILLESSIDSCKPHTAYNQRLKKFDEDMMKKNRKSIEHTSELLKVYLKPPCEVLTEKSEMIVKYHKQNVFFKELYSNIADYFNYPDMKSPVMNKPSSAKPTPTKGPLTPGRLGELPQIPFSKVLTLNSSAKSAEIGEEYGEFKLLQEFISSKGLIQANEPNLSEEAGLKSGKSSVDKNFKKASQKSIIPKISISDYDLNKKQSNSSPDKKKKTSKPKTSPRLSKSPKKELLSPLRSPEADGMRSPINVPNMKWQPGKRGRPPKEEKVVQEIEKDYEADKSMLRQKISLDQAEKDLKKRKTLPLDYDPEANNLEDEIEKAKEWRERYYEALTKKNGELANLISELDGMEVVIPEMQQAAMHKKSWKLWNYKMSLLLRRIKKKLEDFYKDESGEQVTIQEVEEVMQEGETMVKMDNEEPTYRELRDKFEKIEGIRNKIRNAESIKLIDLKWLEKDMKELNIKIPEARLLKDKLEINYQIQKLLEEHYKIKELEVKLEELRYTLDSVDPDLLAHLKNKITEGKKLKDRADTYLIAKNYYNLKELTEMANTSKEAKILKVDIPEIEKLRNLVNNFVLFTKMYGVVFSSQHLDLEKLESGNYGSFGDKAIEELVEECEKEIEAGLDEPKTKELKNLCEFYEKGGYQDNNMKSFFEKATRVLWKEYARNVLDSDGKRNAQDIQNFIETLPTMVEESNERDVDFFKRIQLEGDKIQTWKEKVQDLFRSDPEGVLSEILIKASREEADYGRIFEELEKVENEFAPVIRAFEQDLRTYSDLTNEYKSVQKIIKWIKWINNAIKLRQQVENHKKAIDYNELKVTVDLMDTLGVPNAGLATVLDSWFQEAKTVKKRFLVEYEHMKQVVSLPNPEAFNVKKIIEKNKDKLSIEDATKMHDLLKSLEERVTLPEEKKIIENDLISFDSWASNVEAALERYTPFFGLLSKQEAPLLAERSPLIQKELNTLKASMLNLPLRNEDTENELRLLEWLYFSSLCLNGLRNDVGYPEWKKLTRNGDKFNKDFNPKIEVVVSALKTEVKESENIRNFMELIKKIEDKEREKISFFELSTIMEQFDRCRIPLREERKALDALHQKCLKIKEKRKKMEDLENPEKPILSEFKSLQEHIKKLPIDLQEDYDALQKDIETERKLAVDIQTSPFPDFRTLRKLVMQYDMCPIYNHDAAKLKKSFDIVQGAFEIIKEKESLLRDDVTIIDFDELRTMSEKIEEIEKYKVDDSFSDIKKNLFIKKCNFLQAQQEDEFSQNKFTMNFPLLKALVIEGHNVLKEFRADAKVEKSLHYIDSIMKRAEGRLREIEKIKDVEILDRLPKVAIGFVDFTTEIIDRKAALNPLSIPTKNLDYLNEIPKRYEEPVKRKRGRPRKGEEKNKKDDREKELEKERKRSREAEKERDLLRKEKSKKEKMLQDRERERKDSSRDIARPIKPKKITQYFEPLKKQAENVKDSNPIVIEFKNLLQGNDHLNLNYVECYEFSKTIVRSFPMCLEKREYYDRLYAKMRSLLKKPFIAKSMAENKFSTEYLKSLAIKDDVALGAIEASLKEKAQRLKYPQSHIPQSDLSIIKKKPKKEMIPLSNYNASLDVDYYQDIASQNKKPEKPLIEILNQKYGDSNKAEESSLLKKLKREYQSKDAANGSTSRKYSFTSKSEISTNKWENNQTDKFSDNEEDKEFQGKEPKKEIERKPKPLPPITRKPDHAPIMYNPDAPADSIAYEETAYNYNPENDIPSAGETFNRNNIFKYPPGTVFRIYEGSFSQGDDREYPKLSMYSCDGYGIVTSIPQLYDGDENVLNVSKRISKLNFEKYVNDAFEEMDMRGDKIISGWIEASLSIYKSRCDLFAKELLESGKFGISVYHNSCKLFLMHKKQMTNDLRERLAFKVRKVFRNSDPNLYFIIVHKPRKITSSVIKISPEIVTPFSGNQADENESVDFDEDSSLKEAETDYGAEIDNDDFGAIDDTDDFEREKEEPKRKVNDKRKAETFLEEEDIEIVSSRRKTIVVEDEEDNGEDDGDDVLGDENEVIEMLQVMSQEEILDFAKKLKPRDRDKIIKYLQNYGDSTQDVEGVTNENKREYQPPHYIKKLVNSISKQTMQEARKKVRNWNAYQQYEEKFTPKKGNENLLQKDEGIISVDKKIKKKKPKQQKTDNSSNQDLTQPQNHELPNQNLVSTQIKPTKPRSNERESGEVDKFVGSQNSNKSNPKKASEKNESSKEVDKSAKLYDPFSSIETWNVDPIESVQAYDPTAQPEEYTFSHNNNPFQQPPEIERIEKERVEEKSDEEPNISSFSEELQSLIAAGLIQIDGKNITIPKEIYEQLTGNKDGAQANEQPTEEIVQNEQQIEETNNLLMEDLVKQPEQREENQNEPIENIESIPRDKDDSDSQQEPPSVMQTQEPFEENNVRRNDNQIVENTLIIGDDAIIQNELVQEKENSMNPVESNINLQEGRFEEHRGESPNPELASINYANQSEI